MRHAWGDPEYVESAPALAAVPDLPPEPVALPESAAVPEPVAVELYGRTAAELRAAVPEEVDWLVPGMLARGWAIKIAGREKIGKGKLVTYLLGKLERGEPTVFGPAASEPVR